MAPGPMPALFGEPPISHGLQEFRSYQLLCKRVDVPFVAFSSHPGGQSLDNDRFFQGPVDDTVPARGDDPSQALEGTNERPPLPFRRVLQSPHFFENLPVGGSISRL